MLILKKSEEKGGRGLVPAILPPLATMSTTICSIFSSILAMYFSFLDLGVDKTAKIQKKRDIPKGQPHFLALKIVYGYAAAKMTFDIMRVPVCTLPCH